MGYSIDIPEDITACVYKIWYGDKYIIHKCKTLEVSTSKIMAGLGCFIKGTPKGRNRKDLSYKFFRHIEDNEGKELKVEVIFVHENPYLLLISEQTELNKAKNDENCLNKSFRAYIPKFTQVKGVGSWINRGFYLNFCKWMKKNQGSLAVMSIVVMWSSISPL